MSKLNWKAFDRYVRAQQQKRAWKKSLRDPGPVLTLPATPRLAA